ncbi:hypothetical protein ONE63_001166 [Megalurothrips usitatus]|uniref:Protein takeout n=1 Tax=Megalurothrips usitatus TaxID=439358 RepID=A0AAV7XI21_9NEOP|nr:hypothetical protein ONE63_001166 [Megalurothrips usitatus]
MKGKYRVNGKVLVLPIQGEGDCELRLENATGLFDVNARYLKNGGEKYAEVTDFRVEFNTTRLRMRFDNLFNGNAELSTQMNKFLNDNWVDILQELKPGVLEAFGGAFKEIANRIFLKVPFDKLFLP